MKQSGLLKSTSATNAPALLDLDNDCLWEICKAVAFQNLTQDRDMESLKALSQTNRYMRQFLMPVLFAGVRIQSYQRLLHALKSLKRNGEMKLYIMRCSR